MTTGVVVGINDMKPFILKIAKKRADVSLYFIWKHSYSFTFVFAN